jgi:hypothetical protein
MARRSGGVTTDGGVFSPIQSVSQTYVSSHCSKI